MSARARTLLAFDAAGRGCAAAVWRGGGVVAARQEEMRRGQAERLVPLVEAVLAEAGVPHDALEAIAVTTGPGGFTGVRIGLAAARGYALALGVPAIGLGNFEVLAAQTDPGARVGRTLLVAIDAKRADLYAQAFDAALQPVGEPLALAPEALDAALPPGPLLVAGDAAQAARRALEAAGRDVRVDPAELVDAGTLARLAAERPLPERDAPPPRPVYLRAPDVTPPPGSTARKETG